MYYMSNAPRNTDGALKVIYWSLVAAQVDPDATKRAQMKEIAQKFLAIAPDVKPKLDQLLRPGRMPDE
jgi:hypothetical protein